MPDLFPLWLSLRVAVLATCLAALLGVPMAWWLARGHLPGRDLIGAVVLVPLVLPPTVVGYYLLWLIGRSGPLGRILDVLGIELAFTWRAAVLGAGVAALPLLVRSAQAGLESVDHRLEQAARTLGRGEWNVFWTVTLPLAWRPLAAGLVLGFCRAFGEFGITLMVAGNIPGVTQTLPLAIYDHVQAHALREAHALALVAVVVALGLVLLAGRLMRLRY